MAHTAETVADGEYSGQFLIAMLGAGTEALPLRKNRRFGDYCIGVLGRSLITQA